MDVCVWEEEECLCLRFGEEEEDVLKALEMMEIDESLKARTAREEEREDGSMEERKKRIGIFGSTFGISQL